MTNIFLFGINGKMGKAICELTKHEKNYSIAGGFDLVADKSCNIFSDINDVSVPFDVIVDFSRPETLSLIIDLSTKTLRPVVLATTGYDKISLDKINELAKRVPVFVSGNMSIGISVLCSLASNAAKVFGESADIEIIEKHHNQKVDAPSGTAKILSDAVASGLPYSPSFIYGRHGSDAKRQNGEIAVHSIRGGSVIGEHEVSFYLNDEIITISHSASSRKIFALGALKAAEFIKTKPCGLYTMKDLIEHKN